MTNDTIICSPFEEPRRHFKFDEKKRRATKDACPDRRKSYYYIKSFEIILHILC